MRECNRDAEFRLVLKERSGSVEGIDDEGARAGKTRRIIGTFLGQPTIIGPRAGKACMQQIVHGEIDFSYRAAAGLGPDFDLAAERLAQKRAAREYGLLDQRQIGAGGFKVRRW